MRKTVIIGMVFLLFILICFFGSMSLHLIRMNHELKETKRELVDYDKKVDKEKKDIANLQNKMQNINNNHQMKNERLQNLNAVKKTTMKSINYMKGQLKK